MKKHAFTALLAFALVFSLSAQQPPQQPQMKLEDVQKALSLVDKPQPVPDKYKAGFDAITARETISMLTFLSSDWMEGRDTASRGYLIAADYAASMFKMWGIKPGGEMPTGGFGQRGGQRGGAPAAPPERSYLQEVPFKSITDVQSSVGLEVNKAGTVKTRTFQSGVDYQGGMGGRGGGNPGSLTAPVVFVGYGIQEPSIKFDELAGLNLKGKVVVVLTEAPGRDDPKSPFQAKPELKEKYFPAGPAGGQMAMAQRGAGGPQRFNKLAEIQKLGPAAIIQVANVDNDYATYRNMAAPAFTHINDDRPIVPREPRGSLTIAGAPAGGPMGGASVPSFTVTRDMADAILEGTGKTVDALKAQIEKTMKPASADLAGTKLSITTTAKVSLVRSPNVIGYIEGSDPTLKNEYFVIGAHFDHNGKAGDYIYNGADDNGSGSVGVMNIAKAIAANPVKPKRSIVFALWTGEERGLLGSRYYTLNPTFPMDKTVGYLNYDMISRPYDATTIARSLQRYGVPGAEALVKRIRAPWFTTVNLTEGTPFADIVREMNSYVGLDLAMNFNALGVGSGGSDHASFAQVKKPFVYYMAAMTSDYHQPSDRVEKVSGELIAKISQHGYLTVFKFADQ